MLTVCLTIMPRGDVNILAGRSSGNIKVSLPSQSNVLLLCYEMQPLRNRSRYAETPASQDFCVF